MAVLAISLAACGGSSRSGSVRDSDSASGKLTPTTKMVTGPLGKFFEVVERDYKLSDEGGLLLSLSVEFKRIAEGGPTSYEPSKPTFILELLDEDGNLIEATDYYSSDQMETVLSLGLDETSFIMYKPDEKNLPKATKFKVSSRWKESADGNSDGSTSTISGGSSSFGPSDVLLPSQLKGKVEVISAEKSVGSYGYPSMEITFKLLSKVNTSSMLSQYGQMWIVGVGQTDKGVDVKELLPNYREWRTGDSEGKEFRAFLEGEPGETITLEFTGDNESSNDVKLDLEKVKKFKLKITT